MSCQNGARRVLVLSYEFPPMGGIGSIRTSKTVKYLPEFGWEPVVITVRDAPTNLADGSLEEGLNEDLIISRSYSIEPTRALQALRKIKPGKKTGQSENVLYSYSRLPFQTINTIKELMIPDEKIGWFPFALYSAIRAARETSASMIFSTAPPFSTHLIAYALKSATKLPWVCEFRDPMSDYVFSQQPTRARKWADRRLEESIVKRADAVTCAMGGLVDIFRHRYQDIEENRFHTITGGYDPDDFADTVPLEKYFTMTWSGTMFSDLFPRTLLKVLRDMLDEGSISIKDCVFRIVGTMDMEAYKAISALELEGLLELTGFEDHRESIRLARSSHLLLMQLGGVKRSELIYPGKMFEYLASRRPVLTLAYEGSAARLIRDLGAGTVVEPDDAQGIRDAILFYYDQYKHGCVAEVGNRERTGTFDKRVQTERLARVFDSLANR